MAGENLGLAVKRQMLGILGHDHLGDQRLGRQPGLDQVRRRRGLGHAGASLRAGITRPDGDDHPKLGRRDVEPLAAILADLDHGPAAAGASDAWRFDYLLDAWQLLGQGAGAALRVFDIGLMGCPGSASDGFLDFCDRDLDVLEGQLLLIRIELLRSRPKPRPAQLVHQVLKPRIGFFEKGVLARDRSSCFEVGVLCFDELIEMRRALDVELRDFSASCASNAARRSAGRLIETSRIKRFDHARKRN